MLNRLREETETLHREIEKDNLANRVISHDINLEEYKLLLLQNYLAYAVTEKEIANFLSSFKPVKSGQLHKDLEYLKVNIPPVEDYAKNFSIKNEAEAYGAAYVVEGSALGGMLIAREIDQCPQLSKIDKHAFFNGDRQNTNGWKHFCKTIKTLNLSEAEENQAVQKAKDTFEFFSLIFNETVLEE